MPYKLPLKVFTQRIFVADFLREKPIFIRKMEKFAFEAPLRVRGNVRCSSWAHWKARRRLPISHNWTFFAMCFRFVTMHAFDRRTDIQMSIGKPCVCFAVARQKPRWAEWRFEMKRLRQNSTDKSHVELCDGTVSMHQHSCVVFIIDYQLSEPSSRQLFVTSRVHETLQHSVLWMTMWARVGATGAALYLTIMKPPLNLPLKMAEWQ